MMGHAAERKLDRLIIVNASTSRASTAPRLLAQIRDVFGRECLPLNLPADHGARVVDCFFNRDGHDATSRRPSRRTARWSSRWSRWTPISSTAT